MKEKKTDSFFLFRKSGNRYSFVNKKKNDINNVQIQRLSWSSFPVAKVVLPQETCQPVDMPSRRTKSSENLKAKQAAKGLHNKLSKSKSSSVFKSSSNTMKQLFTIGSSSSVSTTTPSSSSNSSASSSPKVRESWYSGVTHILERCGNENDINTGFDDTFADDFHSRRCSSEGIPPHQEISFKMSPSPGEGLIANKFFLNYTRNVFPVESLKEEDEEDEIMITPKIICAHKKTPDVVRKDRTQIMQELEYIKKLGMLPEELDKEILNSKQRESENQGEHYENYPYMNGDLNLNALRGYKTSTGNEITQRENNVNHSEHPPDEPTCVSVQQDDIQDKNKEENSSLSTSMSSSSTPHLSEEETQTSVIDSDSNEYFGSGSELNTSTLIHVTNPLESSSLNSILVNDYDSENMTNDEDDNESLSFEKRLEDDLEKLVEKEDVREEIENQGPVLDDEEGKVRLRRKERPVLHIDIERARFSRTLSNERLLRRVKDDGYESARSSKSSPRSPRSPAIDIDDLFKQRQKKLEENPVDNLTQVKDLTQRLRLSTKSPSHIDWINSLKNKTDARQLAQVMSPEVVEDSEGIFRIHEKTKEPTEAQREKNLTKALVWIKDELGKMKEQDQQLARQLMHLQLEMQHLRLVRSCTQHEALLEEVTCEEEEQRALMTSTDLIDLPSSQRECAFSSLRDFGVTRMNITNRRFSLR